MMAQQFLKKCAMCGGGDISSTTEVTYKSGKKEIVPVCQSCGHWHFKDTQYAYVISGRAVNWDSPHDLKDTIEEILKEHLPDDIRDLSIEVVEMAS